ncbi:MAG TPA: DNA polymerase III subunit epsilon [Paenalcaligenes hominis]|uniref:DNA polymerase III subunit epsilon n=1 Tax=Paenalcaligenes hominis TaxID=643674 RepID=A0A9D3ABC8_9BURK|nr:DNA polymerase III subunit epsilon [Paenalcaligenes hominis]NJB65710.1 DNA polymerase-3 subunit epsilon [Paenalcaligenes hominis]GGE63612.1 DNA polymerase III subunit epsilon [Paenalcaligenes hominis]HJH24365.1 DNA polymerase III subunit epsilon [Paenalcaligenes hominis]
MRQIVLDTETTGLDPDDGHRLVEIAGVEIANRQLTGSHLHLYVNPGRDSDPEALAVHGLTTQFLADYPPVEDVIDQIIQYVSGAEVIIHNAPFDTKFLNAEFVRFGYKPFTDYCGKITDSLVHARELHPGKRNNLDALCDRYGISNEHRVLHGALLDSELLADVWLAMTRGQESLLMSFGGSNENQTDDTEHLSFDASSLPVIYASEHDLTEHKHYLDNLSASNKAPTLWTTLEQKD